MERILVTGAAGQIGSELIPALRERYGADNVVALWHTAPPAGDLAKSGPGEGLDVTDTAAFETVLKKYAVKKVYHLASILSALGEKDPDRAFKVNVAGLYGVFEAARNNKVTQVTVPSTIAVFGPDIPKDNVPEDVPLHPKTMYGTSKVFQELLGAYYYNKFGLDVRGLRFPGIISYQTEPLFGTTDYASAIFFAAVRENKYKCYLRADTRLPMMYMPDALKALIDLSEADSVKLERRTDYHVASLSFTAGELAAAVTELSPGFSVTYEPDSRQQIADSWPASLNDAAARRDWGWSPKWGLEDMAKDMYENVKRKTQNAKEQLQT